MKTQRFLILFAVLCGCFAASAPDEPENSASDDSDEGDDSKGKGVAVEEEEHHSPGEDPDDDDRLYQHNPDYVEPSDSDDDEEDLHFDEKNTKKVDDSSSKSAIAKALGYDPKTLPRRTARFIKKHRIQMIVLASIFAFRNELKFYVWRALSTPEQDSKTGQVVHVVRISPSSILKILLFTYLMYAFRGASPSTKMLLGSLTGNSSLALILGSILSPSTSAYIPTPEQHYTFEKINERYKKDAMAFNKATDTTTTRLWADFMAKNDSNSSTTTTKETLAQMLLSNVASGEKSRPTFYSSTVILLDWTSLDTSITHMDVLRDQISFLLTEYKKDDDGNGKSNIDEVVLLLESPGGSAADYALASQQVLRLRNAGIQVTICVDKVAASGGYMVGCTSSPGRLFAAPFAVLGSIGVVGQSVNIHKTLEGWGVRPLVFRGGRDKAPVGLIGEVTKEGMDKVQHMVDDTHRAFKRHVVDSRPVLAENIEQIATGDIWIGYDALDVGLIDRIVTSDEYVSERIHQGARVLKLYKMGRRGVFGKPSTSAVSVNNNNSKKQVRDISSLLSLAADFRSLLQRAADTLATFVAEDSGRDSISALAVASSSASPPSC